jgi:hypothetical protein
VDRLPPQLELIPGVEKVELWRSGEGFTLSFTGAEIVELRSFRRRQIGSDELTVISFFEERPLDATSRRGRHTSRTPQQRGQSSTSAVSARTQQLTK